MNKKSWLRIVTITALCALLTTSALASSPKAKKNSTSTSTRTICPEGNGSYG